MKKYYYDLILKEIADAGVDIHNENYKECENFLKVKDMRILCGNDGWMTLEECIERYLLTKHELLDYYESIYDMGNSAELTIEDCQYIALAREIITVMKLTPIEDADANTAELYKIFTRSGGLKERLKTHLNFDIDLFDIRNNKYTKEIFKIFYFFYMLENKYFPKTIVLELLSKPSMENRDNSYHSIKTNNAEVISFIKNSLEKELSLLFKNNAREKLYQISVYWEILLRSTQSSMDFCNENRCDYDFEKIINLLKSVPDKLCIAEKAKSYKHSPIETMYLKILQYEYSGQIKDIMFINKTQPKMDYNVSEEFIDEMKSLQHKKICFSEIERYIDKNALKIAEYVYLKRKTEKEDRRKIRNSIKKVIKLTQFFKNQTALFFLSTDSDADITRTVSEVFIISCLQAILIDDSNETFDYTFHAYEEQSSRKKQVQGALKNDEYTYNALQVYWIRKVMDHWNANIGWSSARSKIRELECVCDGILLKILENPNLDEMIEIHYYYITILQSELCVTEQQINIFNNFERYLQYKGFRYVDDGYKLCHLFWNNKDSNQIYSTLISNIENLLRDEEINITFKFDVLLSNGKKYKEFNFNLIFDYENSTCTMTDFRTAYKTNYIKKMEKLGAVIID